MNDGQGDSNRTRRVALNFMHERHVTSKGSSALAQPGHEDVAKQDVRSFADLPEYRQVLAHQAASDLLGGINPFYRIHEDDAGSTTSIDGRTLVNFASYDYLGLNRHPLLRERAMAAMARYGVSASASRLVAGERPVHLALEQAIAQHYGVDAAVAFVSGYLTNLTTIACLVGAGDLILHDELIHNSAVAGAQLSGATRRSFRHNDLEDLERLLATLGPRHRRVLVIVEGLYSMDGDVADLPGLVRLRSSYGFWLMVDDAHGLGVLGASGRGIFEHFGCNPDDVDIWMGTLSKTVASCGGYIAGSKELIALLKASAGGFVYSVGLSPALAAAAQAGFEIMAHEGWRSRKLQENSNYFLHKAKTVGLDTGQSIGAGIVPVMTGDSVRAVFLSHALMEAGINVMPIIFPAVPEGRARLRFFISCDHTTAQIDTAIAAVSENLRSIKERGIDMSLLNPDQLASHMALQTREDTRK